MKKNYTHICVVLDASGSMESIKRPVQRALANFCDAQSAFEKQGEKICVDVYQFANDVDRLAHNATLGALEHFVKAYRCGGCTALYDAVCQGIDELGAFFASQAEDERPETVLFAIVTDGEENSSRRFNNADVQQRIKLQSETYSWQFVFLASGIDAKAAAADLGMSMDDAVEFDRDQAEANIGASMCRRMASIREERAAKRK